MLTRCMGPADHVDRWYDKKTGECPECGCPVGSQNPHLYKARLGSHLWSQAADAHKTRRQYEAIQKGYEIPPTRQQRKMAREIVRDYL